VKEQSLAWYWLDFEQRVLRDGVSIDESRLLHMAYLAGAVAALRVIARTLPDATTLEPTLRALAHEIQLFADVWPPLNWHIGDLPKLE
jgi:hypothetical protein